MDDKEYLAKIEQIAIDNPDLSYEFIREAVLAKEEMDSGDVKPYKRVSNVWASGAKSPEEAIDLWSKCQAKIDARRDKPVVGIASKEYIRQRSIDIAAGRLIPDESDPKIWLTHHPDNVIHLNKEQFDNFVKVCNDDRPPSPRIIAAMELLDEEGF